MGVFPARRILRRAGAGHLGRAVPVHARSDSGRDHHRHDRSGDVVLSSDSRGHRAPARRLERGDGGRDRHRTAAQGVDRRPLPGGGRAAVPGLHQADRGARCVESFASVSRRSDRARDRCAVAPARDFAESAVFRSDDAQRTGRVPRLLLVLLHQRALAAVPQPPLSARLQHRSPPLLLAVPPAVAVPLERLLPRRGEALVPARGPRRTDAIAVLVLGGIRAGVLHVLLNARVLFDAVLPGAGAAARLRDDGGASRSLAKKRRGGAGRSGRAGRAGCRVRFVASVELARSRRHLSGADAASGKLHAFARAHG